MGFHQLLRINIGNLLNLLIGQHIPRRKPETASGHEVTLQTFSCVGGGRMGRLNESGSIGLCNNTS